ncbi:DUF1566 domain-containing protein [bacterium]|nr:DUF1566 domain-containing protein [bacterium]
MKLRHAYILLLATLALGLSTFAVTYPIVDTGQEECYDNSSVISPPSPGAAFYGQDAQYDGNAPSYTISGDGLTVYDNVTGLTWQQTPDTDDDGDTDADDKLTWTEVQTYPDVLNAASFGGYSDWRVPTIKEQYSLIKFNGQDISGYTGSLDAVQPFIDDDVFDFAYGDTLAGERPIDSQYASSNVYNEYTIPGVPKLFGVNFADGRIKGYDTAMPMGDKTFTLICVRGNADYGLNDFSDNGDGTLTDSATGLMWQKGHSAGSMSWEDALEYAETLTVAGHDDWRLPNAKGLQSILDYSRSPGTTGAAIDPMFDCASITNEAGAIDYPWFWTGTTHATVYGGASAAYICFGRAAGWMQLPGRTYYSYIDVHGAGAQRSDPKSGSPLDFYLGVDSLGNPVHGHGPQGDIIRVENYVRCVRDVESIGIDDQSNLPEEYNIGAYPNPFNSAVNISVDCHSNESGNPEIEIFDIAGRRIDVIARRATPDAAISPLSETDCHALRSASADWQARNDGASELIWTPDETVGSGVYLARVKTGDISLSKKIIYLK